MNWKQDGRVIDIDLSIPKGEYVVVQLDFLSYDYEPCGILLAKTGHCNEDPERHRLNVQIQPGTTTSLHLETRSRDGAYKVVLDGIRGREMTAFERAKAMFR